MYPPSNNNCNYSPILSSNLFHIPSPSMQYEHELYFQTYHHDNIYFQTYNHDNNYFQTYQQVPFIDDLSLHVLADNTETLTNPDNNVKILYNTGTVTSCNYVLEGIDQPEGGCGNKGEDLMSNRISIIRGRISKNNKRSSNKDRHSKINTARGPRDRRMRLSLDAARKFFGLQDLLGFDKASKTVEWLLIKSDSAIHELAAAKGNEGSQLTHNSKQISCSTTTTTTGIGAICASNSISESEVVSGTDETSSNDKNKETAKDKTKKKRKKATKTARRATFEPLTKESRNQARARARERTKNKEISQIGKFKPAAHDLNHSGSSRPINKTCEVPGTHVQQLEQPSFHQENNVDDCNLVVNGNWNLFSIFNYQQNAGISHEHQYTDLQFCGKLWEA